MTLLLSKETTPDAKPHPKSEETWRSHCSAASPELHPCIDSELSAETWEGCGFTELFALFLLYRERIWEVTCQAHTCAHGLACTCKPQLPSGYSGGQSAAIRGASHLWGFLIPFLLCQFSSGSTFPSLSLPHSPNLTDAD